MKKIKFFNIYWSNIFAVGIGYMDKEVVILLPLFNLSFDFNYSNRREDV